MFCVHCFNLMKLQQDGWTCKNCGWSSPPVDWTNETKITDDNHPNPGSR